MHAFQRLIVAAVYLLVGSQPIWARDEALGPAAITAQSVHDTLLNCDIAYEGRETCPGILAGPTNRRLKKYDELAGSYEILATTVEYLHGQNALGAKKLDPLWKLFAAPGTDAEQFLARLDQWTMRAAGLHPLTISEIPMISKSPWMKAFFPDRDRIPVYANGFVAHAGYTALLGAGYLPLVDPHDVFFHVASLADPAFEEVLKRHARAVGSLSAQIGKPNHLDDEQLATFTTSTSKDARPRVWNFLTRGFRDYAVENWSYLTVDAKGRPHLFVQGNLALNAVNEFVRSEKSYGEFADLFFPETEPFNGLTEFMNWPNFDVFAKTEPARQTVQIAKAWLSLALPSEPQLSAAKKKIRDVVDQAEKDFPTPEERSKNVGVVLDRLAAATANDPILRSMMSHDTRVSLSKMLLDLCDEYLKWIDAGAP